MGNKRTLIAAWLVVMSLFLAPRVTYADDVGPGREVRAIRHDLPTLLAARMDRSSFGSRPMVIRSVAIDGPKATAEWDVFHGTCRATLLKRFDRWWLVRLSMLPDNSPLGGGGPLDDSPTCPTATEHYAWELLFDSENYIDNVSTYQMDIRFARNDGANARVQPFAGRAPTQAESWVTPNNNGYFFFSGTIQSNAPVNVDAGTTLDIWFPFALDSTKTYSLTIAHVTPTIGPLDGTLKDNTLHFVLPAFAVSPGADVMGEIDGDPIDGRY